MEVLLAHGANPFLKDASEKNAIDWALARRHSRIVETIRTKMATMVQNDMDSKHAAKEEQLFFHLHDENQKLSQEMVSCLDHPSVKAVSQWSIVQISVTQRPQVYQVLRKGGTFDYREYKRFCQRSGANFTQTYYCNVQSATGWTPLTKAVAAGDLGLVEKVCRIVYQSLPYDMKFSILCHS